jgi:hypothetical protein
MRSYEYMDEGVWDKIKNAVTGVVPGTVANVAKTAQKQSAYYSKILIDDAFKDWQQHIINLSRAKPAITPAEIQTALEVWVNNRLKDRPGTSIPKPTDITNANDYKKIYKYMGDRFAEYFSKPDPTPAPAPTPGPSTGTSVEGLKVLSTDPLIFNFQNSYYYINDTGQWVVSKSPGRPGTVLPDIWQKFFDKQEAALAPKPPTPTPPPTPPAPTPESKISIANLLLEGGNIFKTAEGAAATQRINQADVEPTIAWLERITGLILVPNMLGSTGKNITSGDLDIAVDPLNKAQLISKLEQWCKINNVDTRDFIRKSGISVHFKTPILGSSDRGYVQTDFMFGDTEWLKFSMQGGEPGSKFKGMHRAVLLSSIAKVYGFKWSPTLGLVSRTTNAVVSQDPDQIAMYLLGSNATSKDLASVESILRKIKQQPNYQELIAQAKETLASEKLHLT